MKYVAYNNFDTFYLDILGICDTEADAQELILAAAEEEAYAAFLDDYCYDAAEITVESGENPLKVYLEDKIPEWVDYNEFSSKDNSISFYGYTLLMASEYYDYSIGKEY